LKIPAFHYLARVLALLVCFAGSAGATVAQQTQARKQGAARKTEALQKNSIRSFAAVEISPAELQVSVDYTFAGEAGTNETYIQALPQEKDGSFDPRTVEVEKIALLPGSHHVRLTITKRPRSRDFTSESIRVCLSAPGRAILCEEFPFTKSWGAVSAKDSATPAEILSFLASSTTVPRGDSVTLSWRTENASTVMLGRAGANDFKAVPASGSQSFSLDRTTTFVLMVGRSASKGKPQEMATQTLQVRVRSRPVIGRFFADPLTIRRGLTSRLTWEVYQADQVMLDGAPVSAMGDKIVSPKRTRYYTLTARRGDEIVTERARVRVSPFLPPALAPPFTGVELCKSVDTSGASYRCISPDGPFWRGDEIHVIVRFTMLPSGKHTVKRIIYDSGVHGSAPWKRIHQEQSSFSRTKNGYAEITFQLYNRGKGVRKLELILDAQNNTRSVIPYCVECPGHDEW
jgi:hypothetical protein